MELTCMSCLHEFEGNISLDELGWHGVCPKCGASFPVEVPKGRIVMAFVDDSDDSLDGEHFTDDFRGKNIRTYYAFDTVDEFMEAWYKMCEDPDGMWYWVLDDGKLICFGACDPDDDGCFGEHFGFDAEKRWKEHLGAREVEKVHEVKAELHFKVTQQDIDDIMVSVLEGGINYWCRKAEVVGGKYLGEYASDQISRGGSLMLYDIESSDKWELTLEKFLAGLKMYVENGGAGCVWDEAIDTGEIDGYAADNIVQYALFGELVFG